MYVLLSKLNGHTASCTTFGGMTQDLPEDGSPPRPKCSKLLTGFFKQFYSSLPELVTEKTEREHREREPKVELDAETFARQSRSLRTHRQ